LQHSRITHALDEIDSRRYRRLACGFAGRLSPDRTGRTAGAPGASGARDFNGTNSYGETPSQANPRAHGSSRADPPAPAETTTPGDNSRMNRGGGQ
jgi:hypothetical protein